MDFFSIGTNDLTQYTLAVDRQNPELDAFYDPHHPAVLAMIRMVVENAHAEGIWAGICGELGADLSLTKEFLKMGVDELSVSPGRVLPIRKVIVERRIAQFAAGLIQPDDFVYLDAGTTTGYILDYLPARSATFVTNAVSHAKRLAAAGNRVILIGGELKGTTEVVIGSQAILTIQGYHFTKGFFGTNGVSKRHGFTTPDPNEALVKQEAMRQTERCYVLADSQKFGMVSSVTFGVFEEATILTETEPPEGFSGSKNIRVAK